MIEHAETGDVEPTEILEPRGLVSTRPRAHERGKMRRRLRRQREVREALLLDLGALVFELHRQDRREPELLQTKASELASVDDEVRALAAALDENLSLAPAGLELESEPSAQPRSELGSRPEPEPEPETEPEPEAEAELEPEGELEPETAIEPEAETAVEPEAEGEPEGEAARQATAVLDRAPWLAPPDDPDDPAGEGETARAMRRQQSNMKRFLRGERPTE